MKYRDINCCISTKNHDFTKFFLVRELISCFSITPPFRINHLYNAIPISIPENVGLCERVNKNDSKLNPLMAQKYINQENGKASYYQQLYRYYCDKRRQPLTKRSRSNPLARRSNGSFQIE